MPWVAMWGLSLRGQTLRMDVTQAWPAASGGPWGSMHPKDSPGPPPVPFGHGLWMVLPKGAAPASAGVELRSAWE